MKLVLALVACLVAGALLTSLAPPCVSTWDDPLKALGFLASFVAAAGIVAALAYKDRAVLRRRNTSDRNTTAEPVSSVDRCVCGHARRDHSMSGDCMARIEEQAAPYKIVAGCPCRRFDHAR